MENELDRIWDPVDRFFNQEDWPMVTHQFIPRVNVLENNEFFKVMVELPGMTAKDVKVEYQNGILWIVGEKKRIEEEKDWVFHRFETIYGEFNRRIELPGAVKEAEIAAEFVNGVLQIIVPKSEVMKPRQIKVKNH
jgi:HSP20 family protein